MVTRILAHLLHLANQSPTLPEIFYPIKTKLLLRYGVRVSTDLQVFDGVRCNACDRGNFIIYSEYYPDRVLDVRRCRHCNGTTWYKPTRIVQLDVYRIGTHQMHLPTKSTPVYTSVSLPKHIIFGNVIHGYIRKPMVNTRDYEKCLVSEAFLCLLFNRKAVLPYVNRFKHLSQKHAIGEFAYKVYQIACIVAQFHKSKPKTSLSHHPSEA